MSEWLSNNPAALAALYAAVGGILLKIAEHRIGRGAERRADRADYRMEITELNVRIDKLEADLLRVRDLYFASQEENAQLRSAMIQGGIVPPPRVRI